MMSGKVMSELEELSLMQTVNKIASAMSKNIFSAKKTGILFS